MTMRTIRSAAAMVAVLGASVVASTGCAFAGSHDHGGHHAGTAVVADSFTAGEVRKVDAAAGKITIRHAEIRNLDMPAMTMVFLVRDRALLDGLKAGERIMFKAESPGGALTVTEIRRVD